ncbi:hypothetical protein NA57DRAFT_82335 [Rhizodiscina lignyota]|uniref:SRR1-like domain-containing protein n=1 Tax=Rhizodiscina lignyota TaxID=1504668 RepID=A0A9P4I041_9PEZI|nr:hypothetical protein NA57DRAFT_82335 [Rhizodiscina lignyota]
MSTPNLSRRYSCDNKDEATIQKEVDELCCLFTNARIKWQKSPFREIILSVLEKDLGPLFTTCNEDDHHHVDSAICMALGSFHVENDYKWTSSMLQLIFFLDVVELLYRLSHGAEHIKLLAQDPRFNRVDTAFLSIFDIEVLDAPKAVDYITTKTFLFTPCIIKKPLLASILPDRDPLLYVGHNISRLLQDLTSPIPAPGVTASLGMTEQLVEKAGMALDKDIQGLAAVARGFLFPKRSCRVGKQMYPDASLKNIDKRDEAWSLAMFTLQTMWIYFRQEESSLEKLHGGSK